MLPTEGNANTESAALARSYRSLFPGLDTTIHPDDEMYAYTTRFLGGPESQAFADYMCIGHNNMRMLDQVVTWVWGGGGWNRLSAILDFASGYGRTTRFLRTVLDAEKLWISDILGCRGRLPD